MMRMRQLQLQFVCLFQRLRRSLARRRRGPETHGKCRARRRAYATQYRASHRATGCERQWSSQRSTERATGLLGVSDNGLLSAKLSSAVTAAAVVYP